jgi:hypothetical protein
MNHNPETGGTASANTSKQLVRAVQTLLAPLVQILIRNGTQAPAVIDAFKRAYVGATEAMLTEKGQPGTAPRIALFAGLSRSDVERIQHTTGIEAEGVPSKFDQIATLLTTWHLDDRYAIPFMGTPRDLPFRAHSGDPSFQTLANECAPGRDAAELLSELERLEIALTDPNTNLIRVRARAYVPEPYDDASIERLGRMGRNYLATLETNFRDPSPGKGRFERHVISDFALDVSDEGEFDTLIRKDGQKFLEDLDAWLAKRTPASQGGRKVGVVVFHYVEDATGIDDASKGRSDNSATEQNAARTEANSEPKYEPTEIDVLNFKR